MTEYDWLLLFHVFGAFLFVSGSIVAGILQLAAMRRDRPSEIALLLGLTRPAVALVGAGSMLTLGLGLWLADDAGYEIGEGWVIASLGLWVASMALGGVGGRPLRRARELAERLAANGDRPDEGLRRAVGDRRVLALSYLSFTALIAILVLMIWKPGT